MEVALINNNNSSLVSTQLFKFQTYCHIYYSKLVGHILYFSGCDYRNKAIYHRWPPLRGVICEPPKAGSFVIDNPPLRGSFVIDDPSKRGSFVKDDPPSTSLILLKNSYPRGPGPNRKNSGHGPRKCRIPVHQSGARPVHTPTWSRSLFSFDLYEP